MKLTNYVCLVFLFTCFACSKSATQIEKIVVNTDSIKCAEEWRNFQLQQDTILLTLKYKEPYVVESGKDKLTITILDVIDDCSEESAMITYGCDVEVSLKLQLNNKCEYVTKYPISIGRYSLQHWKFNSIKDLYCNFSNSNALILNERLVPHLLFYNIMVTLWQVDPFFKKDKELMEVINNKEQYKVILYLQRRCY